MQAAHRWPDRNLSRLELVIAFVIILALIGLFMRHMYIVFAEAEQSMVNGTVNNINSALKYQALFYLMKEDYRDLADLAAVNPMDAMQGNQMNRLLSGGTISSKQVGTEYRSIIKPGNYIGAFDDPDPSELGKGVWYYDTGRRLLVYIIRNTEFFSSDLGGMPRLRFRIEVEYEDTDGNGVFDPPVDKYRSVHISCLDHYEWTI